MKKIYCNTCKNKHFNNYQCSKCGHNFSMFWPKVDFGSNSKEPLAKYCANCGHKFNKENDNEKI